MRTRLRRHSATEDQLSHTATNMADYIRAGLSSFSNWFGQPRHLVDVKDSHGEPQLHIQIPATQAEPEPLPTPQLQSEPHPQLQVTSSKGWGDHIQWLQLNDAYTAARTSSKPMMVIIHKMSCGACITQKRWFSASKNVEALTKDLVMVNMEYSQVPRDPQFTPDGEYVPRILFFSPDGKFLSDVKAKLSHAYKYNYATEGDLLKNMKSVIQQFKNWKA